MLKSDSSESNRKKIGDIRHYLTSRGHSVDTIQAKPDQTCDGSEQAYPSAISAGFQTSPQRE